MDHRPHTVARALALALGAAALALGMSACSPSTAPPATGTSSISAPTSAAPQAPTSAAPQARKPVKHITGTITAQNGTTWTMVSKKGNTYTVTVTETTRFGTTSAPATREQFPVGSEVRVSGDKSGKSITATRIKVPVTQPPPPAAVGTAGAPAN